VLDTLARTYRSLKTYRDTARARATVTFWRESQPTAMELTASTALVRPDRLRVEFREKAIGPRPSKEHDYHYLLGMNGKELRRSSGRHAILGPPKTQKGDTQKGTWPIRASGAIPAGCSDVAWRAGILALLDRRPAEHRRFPSVWRSALRSDRPKQLRINRVGVVGPKRASSCLVASHDTRWAEDLAGSAMSAEPPWPALTKCMLLVTDSAIKSA
jgi:hypothetical protein